MILYSYIEQKIWKCEIPVVPLTQLLYAIFFLLFKNKSFINIVNCNDDYTAQKNEVFIKDFFSKCDQICSFLNGKLHFLCSDSVIYLLLASY